MGYPNGCKDGKLVGREVGDPNGILEGIEVGSEKRRAVGSAVGEHEGFIVVHAGSVVGWQLG